MLFVYFMNIVVIVNNKKKKKEVPKFKISVSIQ